MILIDQDGILDVEAWWVLFAGERGVLAWRVRLGMCGGIVYAHTRTSPTNL